MDKFILEIPNFLSHDLCNHLIEKFEKHADKIENGKLRYFVDGEHVDLEKPNKELDMSLYPDFKDVDATVQKYVSSAIKTYLKHLESEFDFNKKPFTHPMCQIITNDRITDAGYFIHRIPHGSIYEWHTDQVPFGPKTQSHGFVQAIIYLNTLQPHEGGCTEFVNGRKVRPEIGKMLMFPRSWTYPHSGERVEAPFKYILTVCIYMS